MYLQSLPSDILKSIGLYLDGETIITCFRLLDKRINLLCRDEFWKEKYIIDFRRTKLNKVNIEFYPNYFYHYLAQRSRCLIKMIESLTQFIASKKKILEDVPLEMRIWKTIYEIQLRQIQAILCEYLIKKHPQSFKYHLLNLNRFNDGVIPEEIVKLKGIHKYNLLVNTKIENREFDLTDTIIVGVMTTGQNSSFSLSCDPPYFFYCFLWSLGIYFINTSELYKGSNINFTNYNPYKFRCPNIDPKLKPITEDVIKRYFGSRQNYDE